jgi:hypothetical protein
MRWRKYSLSFEQALELALSLGATVEYWPREEDVRAVVINNVCLVAQRGVGSTYLMSAEEEGRMLSSPLLPFTEGEFDGRWKRVGAELESGSYFKATVGKDRYLFLTDENSGERTSFMLYPALYPQRFKGMFPESILETLPGEDSIEGDEQ